MPEKTTYNTTQRIAALYCFLAAEEHPVDAESVRTHVNGYSPDESFETFRKKFRRDKDELDSLGIHVEENADGRCRIDQTFRSRGPVSLNAQEAATLRACAASALSSPSFILHAELLRALNKLADDPSAHIADIEELSGLSGNDDRTAVTVYRACQNAKTLTFSYTNRQGACRARIVDPYVLRNVGSDWYLDGLERSAPDEIRPQVKTFRLSRMDKVQLLSPKRLLPDFTVPADFDPQTTAFAFDIGPDDLDATLFIDERALWKGDRLTRGQSSLSEMGDGMLWKVHVADEARFFEWLARNYPGVTLVAPDALVDRWERALECIARGADADAGAGGSQGVGTGAGAYGKGGA